MKALEQRKTAALRQARDRPRDACGDIFGIAGVIGGRKAEPQIEADAPRRPAQRPLGGDVNVIGSELLKIPLEAPLGEELELDVGGERSLECRFSAGVRARRPAPHAPFGSSSATVISNVLATPLICGRQVSDTMRIFTGDGFAGSQKRRIGAAVARLWPRWRASSQEPLSFQLHSDTRHAVVG